MNDLLTLLHRISVIGGSPELQPGQFQTPDGQIGQGDPKDTSMAVTAPQENAPTSDAPMSESLGIPSFLGPAASLGGPRPGAAKLANPGMSDNKMDTSPVPQAALGPVGTPTGQLPTAAPVGLTPTSGSQFRNLLANAPPIQDEHPGMFRRFLASMSAMGAGTANGPEAGAEAKFAMTHPGLMKGMVPYNINLGRAKTLADYDAGVASAGLNAGKVTSEINKNNAEGANYNSEAASRPTAAVKQQYEVDMEKLKQGKPDYIKMDDGTIQAVSLKPDGSYDTKQVYAGDPKRETEIKDILVDGITHTVLLDKNVKKDNPNHGIIMDFGETGSANPQHYNSYRKDYLEKHPGAGEAEVTRAYAKDTQQPERPPQTLIFTPGPNGYTAQAARPGSQVASNAITAPGMNAINTPTSQTRAMAETAPKVSFLADQVNKEIDKQVAALGPAAGRWSEFMTGKVGAPNPEFAKLRTDTTLLATALMRMHVGARGGEAMIGHFMDLIDSGKQSPQNMKAAIEEIKAYADEVASSGKSGVGDQGPAPPGGSNQASENKPIPLELGPDGKLRIKGAK